MYPENDVMVIVDGFHLKNCPYCGGNPEFISKEQSSHTFWRVVCIKCGCGTWCDGNGYGHEDAIGKELSALEWNQRSDGFLSK